MGQRELGASQMAWGCGREEALDGGEGGEDASITCGVRGIVPEGLDSRTVNMNSVVAKGTSGGRFRTEHGDP